MQLFIDPHNCNNESKQKANTKGGEAPSQMPSFQDGILGPGQVGMKFHRLGRISHSGVNFDGVTKDAIRHSRSWMKLSANRGLLTLRPIGEGNRLQEPHCITYSITNSKCESSVSGVKPEPGVTLRRLPEALEGIPSSAKITLEAGSRMRVTWQPALSSKTWKTLH